MQKSFSAGEGTDLAIQGMFLVCPSVHMLNYEYEKYLIICQTWGGLSKARNCKTLKIIFSQ